MDIPKMHADEQQAAINLLRAARLLDLPDDVAASWVESAIVFARSISKRRHDPYRAERFRQAAERIW